LRALHLASAYKAYPGLEYHPAATAFFKARSVELTPVE
ncbi:unnamed protein product, partial [Scytosiphon promiscuus]